MICDEGCYGCMDFFISSTVDLNTHFLPEAPEALSYTHFTLSKQQREPRSANQHTTPTARAFPSRAHPPSVISSSDVSEALIKETLQVLLAASHKSSINGQREHLLSFSTRLSAPEPLILFAVMLKARRWMRNGDMKR